MLSTMFNAWWPFTGPWHELPQPIQDHQRPGRKAGNFASHCFTGAARPLQYKLFIPDRNNGRPRPLIVMLHGGGQDAEDFALGTRMNAIAAESGCMVLYPEQSSHANWSRCWNWFDAAHHQRGQGEAALIAAVTRNVMANHWVDSTRVYAAGLSAGGAMAVVLGQTYPDLFAAVGCHSGLPHGIATDQHGALLAMRDGLRANLLARTRQPASTPTIVFHGDMDSTVHPDNGFAVVRQSFGEHPAGTLHTRPEIAASTHTGEAGGRNFTRVLYRNATGALVAEYWALHGIGHAWSGGDCHGSHADPHGPDASKEMLRFFLRQRLT
jgi:poly(hydroxyalkanoate) depolymerase family esterase